MGLFKEILCDHCGEKTNIVTRSKLKDGKYICSKCTSMVPHYIKVHLWNYEYKDFVKLKQYINYSEHTASRVFKETHSFLSLHLDSENGLFYFTQGLMSTPVYFQVEDVESISLEYDPDKFKEGVFSDKVTGKVTLKLKMVHPYFSYEKDLANGVKASAHLKQGVFKDKVEYDNPKGMDEFIAQFQDAYTQFLYTIDRSNRFDFE